MFTMTARYYDKIYASKDYRGEAEKVLRVKVEIPERDWQVSIYAVFQPRRVSPLAGQLELAIADSAERLLLPAIERDVRRELTEKAELHAIAVFASNLRGLLSQPPLSGQTVLGIDPGFRTGCKVAVVDATGKLLDTGTIYPHEPRNDWQGALHTLQDMINRHHVTLISIGNGTASRETEKLASDLTRNAPQTKYLIVNEAGASVYSASALARQEFPDLDVTIRGAVSIARRAQDPLAELVKIDPKSIGVGQYQHDVDQSSLAHALEGVVESVVNRVGVDANTASPALLTHVAGVGPKLAGNIVAYRDANGPFKSRAALRKVAGLGPKAFEQAAGFLRIQNGTDPLDASAIHPESYEIAKSLLALAGLSADSPFDERISALDALTAKSPLETLAQELNCGLPTLQDILEQHEDAMLAIASGRYEWIGRMMRAAVTHPRLGQISLTDRIDLWATSNVFKAGHRLRLYVSSSNFPRFDRNRNTGGPILDATGGVTARQTVYHDTARPSALVLPVVPR